MSVFAISVSQYALKPFTAASLPSQAEKGGRGAFSGGGSTDTPGGGEEACRGKEN